MTTQLQPTVDSESRPHHYAQTTGVLFSPVFGEEKDRLIDDLAWERELSSHIKENETISRILASFAVGDAVTVLYPPPFSSLNNDSEHDFAWSKWYHPANYYENKPANMVGGLIYRGPSKKEWKEIAMDTSIDVIMSGELKVDGWTSHT